MIYYNTSLALTQGERDAIYEAVINLVEARLKKAAACRGHGMPCPYVVEFHTPR